MSPQDIARNDELIRLVLFAIGLVEAIIASIILRQTIKYNSRQFTIAVAVVVVLLLVTVFGNYLDQAGQLLSDGMIAGWAILDIALVGCIWMASRIYILARRP